VKSVAHSSCAIDDMAVRLVVQPEADPETAEVRVCMLGDNVVLAWKHKITGYLYAMVFDRGAPSCQ
jgi:hypothetical protein